MVLVGKGLHYLRVKGFTALPLIPGVRASVPHLRIGNKLFLAAPQFPFRLVQELKLCPCTVGLCLGWDLFPALSSYAFLEGCSNQPVLAWFCFLSIKGSSLSTLWWFIATRQLAAPWSCVALAPAVLTMCSCKSAAAFTALLAGRVWESEAEVAQVLVAEAALLY